MRKTNKHYEAPQVEVIEIEPQGILCTSGGSPVTNKGAGTTNMGMSEITDFWHG